MSARQMVNSIEIDDANEPPFGDRPTGGFYTLHEVNSFSDEGITYSLFDTAIVISMLTIMFQSDDTRHGHNQ